MEETRFVLCGPRRQTGDIPSVKLDEDNFSDNARGDTRQLNLLTLSVYSTAAIDLDKKTPRLRAKAAAFSHRTGQPAAQGSVKDEVTVTDSGSVLGLGAGERGRK